MVGAKKPPKPKNVRAIRFFREHEGHLRDRALFDFAIDSKLRGCDVVTIKIGDVEPVLSGYYRENPRTLARALTQ